MHIYISGQLSPGNKSNCMIHIPHRMLRDLHHQGDVEVVSSAIAVGVDGACERALVVAMMGHVCHQAGCRICWKYI